MFNFVAVTFYVLSFIIAFLRHWMWKDHGRATFGIGLE